MPRRVSSPVSESDKEHVSLASRGRGKKGGSDDEADLTGSTAPRRTSGSMRVAILTAMLLLSLYAVFQMRRLSSSKAPAGSGVAGLNDSRRIWKTA